jgi:HAD superfamily hydrolase (TIGR01509 family)
MPRRPPVSWKLTKNGRYQAILFDFDGVLADSEPIHFACWREVLLPHGIDMQWDAYCAHCVGVSDRDMIHGFSAAAGREVRFEELWGEYPRKQELFAERMQAADVFLPDTLDLIRSLSAYRLAVVSSSKRSEIEPPLVGAAIRDCFELLVCGTEEVERLKPAPDPYLHAARKLGVEHPLVIEDSDAGERSGRAAGFDVLRIRSPREVASKVRAVLDGTLALG